MVVQTGTLLGPYKILGLLGAGGMGEVYRAEDTRLDRQVAVKVISQALTGSREHLARFEREARALARLNHPNVLAVFDIGTHEDALFIVTELLAGEPLRRLIDRGQLPLPRALQYASQIAAGLSVAHANGIVHRDLKPGNVFVTQGHHIKILDFGLAAVRSSLESKEQREPDRTEPVLTMDSAVLGSPGYMAPEQCIAGAVDHRCDIFAFGCCLYEMITGEPAFRRETISSTVRATLSEDPKDMRSRIPDLPSNVKSAIERCLAKEPSDRFQSIRDAAYVLELPRDEAPRGVASERTRRLRWGAIACVMLLSASVAGYASWRHWSQSITSYQRLTFQQGTIVSARFGRGDGSVYYGAVWDDGPVRVYLTMPGKGGSRRIDVPAGDVLSLSREGDLAVSLDCNAAAYNFRSGTLAKVPLTGGGARELQEDVSFADYLPDGRGLAIIRFEDGSSVIEWPLGTHIHRGRPAGYLRVSPDGSMAAFWQYTGMFSDEGRVVCIDRRGKTRALTGIWSSGAGLAWSPDGKEVWFTATQKGSARALHAVDTRGHIRLVQQFPGSCTLQDIAADGSVLVCMEDVRNAMMYGRLGETKETCLSWFDSSLPIGLSADGSILAFGDYGEGAGYAPGDMPIYVRKTDGALPVLVNRIRPLGYLGSGGRIAADGDWIAFVEGDTTHSTISMYPLGPGTPKSIPSAWKYASVIDFRIVGSAAELLILGGDGVSARDYYLLDERGGSPRPIAPGAQMADKWILGSSGDFKRVLASDQEGRMFLIHVGSTQVDTLPWKYPTISTECGWDGGNDAVFCVDRRPKSYMIKKLDLHTGAEVRCYEIKPSLSSGIPIMGSCMLSRDCSSYVYVLTQTLSTLYLIKGLR
jgi:eukaryotic-like serine/threonine-protein kinase